MKNLKPCKPKPTQMTLTLSDRLITYPYGVLEDFLVRVDGLLFPVNFVMLDILEDTKTPLFLGRPFLEKVKALINFGTGRIDTEI